MIYVIIFVYLAIIPISFFIFIYQTKNKHIFDFLPKKYLYSIKIYRDSYRNNRNGCHNNGVVIFGDQFYLHTISPKKYAITIDKVINKYGFVNEKNINYIVDDILHEFDRDDEYNNYDNYKTDCIKEHVILYVKGEMHKGCKNRYLFIAFLCSIFWFVLFVYFIFYFIFYLLIHLANITTYFKKFLFENICNKVWEIKVFFEYKTREKKYVEVLKESKSYRDLPDKVSMTIDNI